MPRKFFLLSFVLLVSCALRISAQTKDPIEHLWYDQDKTAKIEIYLAKDGKYYGKIVWLKVPTVNGKNKIDIHNPDEQKRNEPILGLVLLRGFNKEGKNIYEDGTVYDPKGGRTYSCKMTLNGNKLNVHGYWGISIIGRSTTWTMAD
ncbi:MAG: DUF2147 domain-containing protein [Taibaiella sp.]|nr:DUF2147 domain-containing protein [Taibaiella sp.]